jgi:hypothetical protein
MSLRYLLDENLPPAWRRQLLRRDRNLVIRCIGDPGTPPKQSPDPVILEWCETHQFILVSNNRHSMPGHLADHLAAGRHVPGILIITGKMTVGRILDELALIAGATLADEYLDQIRFLPIT